MILVYLLGLGICFSVYKHTNKKIIVLNLSLQLKLVRFSNCFFFSSPRMWEVIYCVFHSMDYPFQKVRYRAFRLIANASFFNFQRPVRSISNK